MHALSHYMYTLGYYVMYRITGAGRKSNNSATRDPLVYTKNATLWYP